MCSGTQFTRELISIVSWQRDLAREMEESDEELEESCGPVVAVKKVGTPPYPAPVLELCFALYILLILCVSIIGALLLHCLG